MGAEPLAVVQARMTSTRLPGKSIAEVCGEPMLALVLARLSRSRSIGRIVVATSVARTDDPIAELAEELGYGVQRGPLEDVLARYAAAAEGHDGPVVRITGDCPLIDPAVVDAVIALFLATPGCAYATNFDPRGYPDGLDAEVLDADALRAAAAEAREPIEREHVTPFLRRDPERFLRVGLPIEEDLSELRWTVDFPSDLDFVRAVVERLGDRRYDAGMDEIRAAIGREPSLADFAGARRA